MRQLTFYASIDSLTIVGFTGLSPGKAPVEEAPAGVVGLSQRTEGSVLQPELLQELPLLFEAALKGKETARRKGPPQCIQPESIYLLS